LALESDLLKEMASEIGLALQMATLWDHLMAIMLGLEWASPSRQASVQLWVLASDPGRVLM
jgi:hypothetical protein